MLADERRSRLLELVRRQGFAPLNDLARSLRVSESTIRRDLAHLEGEGSAQRTHGGAFYTGPAPSLPHFEARQNSQLDKKRAIAQAAVKLIEENDTILLDGGSTTYEVARLLVDRTLQVVTNSLPVANLFTSVATADLILVGGFVHSRSGTTQGHYAEQMLRSLNVRWALVSAAGLDERGLYNSNLQMAAAELAMMDAAEEVLALIDSTKFGHLSLSRVCGLERLNRVVVDDGLSAAWRKKMAAAGVELIVAEPLEEREDEENSKAEA